MSRSSPADGSTISAFQHEAVFYRGVDDLVQMLVPHILDGLEDEVPVMVALLPDRISALKSALGSDAAAVTFADMAEVGRNPARIIPVWREFVDRIPPGTVGRGVGEPVWAGRRAPEIEECRLHESLLNLAFDEGPAWQLLCPYDVEALSDRIVEDAMRTHPVVVSQPGRRAPYEGHLHAWSAFTAPLATPPDAAQEFSFDGSDLGHLRRIVQRVCDESGLSVDAGDDLVLAAHELAANSIQHGGGWGWLTTWREPDALVVEVRDSGTIHDPLVGREPTSGMAENGRGVWMANQLCDLVQVRSTSTQTAVRLFAWL